METKTEYSITYIKKLTRNSHHVSMTRTSPTLEGIMKYYRDVMKWSKEIPDMELSVTKMVKRVYTDENLLPEA